MSIPHLILFIFWNYPLSKTLHTSYKNECGVYKGNETENNPTLEECLSDEMNKEKLELDSEKCCLITGYINLTTRTTCVKVLNTTEGRISVLEEFNSFSTGIKVNCGNHPEFKSDCGPDHPNERKDCFDSDVDGYDCCFVRIKSKQFTGDACRKYKNIDQNAIAEAVSAAKTVGAFFEVDCHSFYLFNHYLFILLFSFFLFF